MGEYLLVNGHSVKIGTCEDLYYTTYDQLSGWIAQGIAQRDSGSLTPAEYVAPDSGFRFRFPFPDEDGVDLSGIANYHRGLTISAPADFMANGQHVDRWQSVHPHGQGGGFHFNISYPCPASKEFRAQKVVTVSRDGVPNVIQIVSQKLVQVETSHGEARLWTCARCAYCESMFRMSPEMAIQLVDHEVSIYGEVRHTELFRRMLAGYNSFQL